MSEASDDNTPKPSILGSVVLKGCICNRRNGLQDGSLFCPGPHDKIIPSLSPPPTRVHKTNSNIRAEAPSYKQKKPHRQNVPPQDNRQQEKEDNVEPELVHPPSEGASKLHPPITNTHQQVNDQGHVSQQAEPGLFNPAASNTRQVSSSRQDNGEHEGYPPRCDERRQHHRISPTRNDDFEGYPPINQQQRYHHTSAHSPDQLYQNRRVPQREEETSYPHPQQNVSLEQEISMHRQTQKPPVQPSVHPNQQGVVYENQRHSEIPHCDTYNTKEVVHTPVGRTHEVPCPRGPESSFPSGEAQNPEHHGEGFAPREVIQQQRSPREHHESRSCEPRSCEPTATKQWSTHGRENCSDENLIHPNEMHYNYPEQTPNHPPENVQNSTGVRRSSSRRSVYNPSYIEAGQKSEHRTTSRRNLHTEEIPVSRMSSRCSACREHGHKPALPVRVCRSKKSVCPDVTDTTDKPVVPEVTINVDDENKNITGSNNQLSPRKPAIRACKLVKQCDCNKRNGLGGDRSCRMCSLTSSITPDSTVVNRAEIEGEMSPRRNRMKEHTHHYHTSRGAERKPNNAIANERQYSYGDDSDPLANGAHTHSQPLHNHQRESEEYPPIHHPDNYQQQTILQPPCEGSPQQREQARYNYNPQQGGQFSQRGDYQQRQITPQENTIASQPPPGYRQQIPRPNYRSQEDEHYAHNQKYYMQSEVSPQNPPVAYVPSHEYKNRPQEGNRQANRGRDVDRGNYQTPPHEYSKQQVHSDPQYVQQTYDNRQLRPVDSSLTVVGEPQTTRYMPHGY